MKTKREKAADLQGKLYEIELTRKAISIDEENHRATFVMSTATIDRHGDVVDQDTWMLTHFMENPAFFWGHRSNDFPLGKWVDVRLENDPAEEGQKMLVGTAEFAVEVHSDIKRAWDHVVRGDLNMVSVGFIPHIVDYDDKKDAYILKNCELMECSLVGIGANRRALVKSQDIKEALIETKQHIEESIEDTDPAATRKRNAILFLNKAIRQLKSER